MSEYTFYKLIFPGGVHFGTGMLSSSDFRFLADSLFSALYIEAMKCGCADALLRSVSADSICISDCFPFYKDQYFIPKPMLRIAASDTGNSMEKKFYKNLKFIPASSLKSYLSGDMEKQDPLKDLISISSRTMAAISRNGDVTLPYQVGICSFAEGAGLYFIAKTETPEDKEMLDDLLTALSSVGIGGKRSAGLGKFTLLYGHADVSIVKRLQSSNGIQMLLSCALPKEEELESAMDGASYGVLPRSGFILSDSYADEQRKRHTLFAFESGSCFRNTFDGDIYNVSQGGTHPVYRYAKPLFISLSGELQ